ncbi:hypothetical protein [Pseudomonas sp. 8 R 14]|nr:hypothetical protein [Pseudomonas sp. 8 R 14]
MLHQHQHMLLGRQAQQLDPQQWTLLQIEWLGDLGFHQRLEFGFLGVDQGNIHPYLIGNHLQGTVALLLQMRAQAFMAQHQCVKAALQRGHVQLAGKAQGPWHMIGGALRLQLPQKPLPLLGIREPKRLTFLALENRGNLKQVDALLLEHYRQRFLLLRRK